MERQYVGIDLHRRTSTVYRMSPDGEMLGCERIPSEPLALAEAVGDAGSEPEVVLESTYGWYWAADLLEPSTKNAGDDLTVSGQRLVTDGGIRPHR